MSVYVYRDGEMVDKATGEPMLTEADREKPLQAPRTFGDEEPFLSPVDGRVISGNREWKEDLKRNNCVPAQDLKPYDFKRKFKNKAFVEKRGLQDMAAEEIK